MKLGHHAQTFVDLMIQFTPKVLTANSQGLLNKKSPQGSCGQTGVCYPTGGFGYQLEGTPAAHDSMALVPMTGTKQYWQAHTTPAMYLIAQNTQIQKHMDSAIPFIRPRIVAKSSFIAGTHICRQT